MYKTIIAYHSGIVFFSGTPSKFSHINLFQIDSNQSPITKIKIFRKLPLMSQSQRPRYIRGDD